MNNFFEGVTKGKSGSYFKSTPDGKGGFTTINWTWSGELVASIASGIISYVIIGIFCAIIAPLFTMFTYITSFIEKERKASNIIGIISGIYFLLDYHYGWLSNLFLRIPAIFFGGNAFINSITYFNTSLLITHFILLFFDIRIWFSLDVDDESKRYGRFVSMILGIILFSYMLAYNFLPHILPQFNPAVYH